MTLRELRERERVSECVHESVSKRMREKREPNAPARVFVFVRILFSQVRL